jgi:hypothetical protein
VPFNDSRSGANVRANARPHRPSYSERCSIHVQASVRPRWLEPLSLESSDAVHAREPGYHSNRVTSEQRAKCKHNTRAMRPQPTPRGPEFRTSRSVAPIQKRRGLARFLLARQGARARQHRAHRGSSPSFSWAVHREGRLQKALIGTNLCGHCGRSRSAVENRRLENARARAFLLDCVGLRVPSRRGATLQGVQRRCAGMEGTRPIADRRSEKPAAAS